MKTINDLLEEKGLAFSLNNMGILCYEHDIYVAVLGEEMSITKESRAIEVYTTENLIDMVGEVPAPVWAGSSVPMGTWIPVRGTFLTLENAVLVVAGYPKHVSKILIPRSKILCCYKLIEP